MARHADREHGSYLQELGHFRIAVMIDYSPQKAAGIRVRRFKRKT